MAVISNCPSPEERRGRDLRTSRREPYTCCQVAILRQTRKGGCLWKGIPWGASQVWARQQLLTTPISPDNNCATGSI